MSMYKNLVIGTLSQDSFVMVNKTLAKKIGFVEAGLLAELIFTYKGVEKNNAFYENGEHGPWFYLTQASVEESLGIMRREHENAIKNLCKFGLIIKKRLGIPSKNYYQIDWKKISELFEENDPEPAPQSDCTKRTIKEGLNVQSGLDETYNLDCTKRPFIHIKNKKIKEKDIKKIKNKNHVNKGISKNMENPLTKDDITEIANTYYSSFASGR
jgi:hypothetical protein